MSHTLQYSPLYSPLVCHLPAFASPPQIHWLCEVQDGGHHSRELTLLYGAAWPACGTLLPVRCTFQPSERSNLQYLYQYLHRYRSSLRSGKVRVPRPGREARTGGLSSPQWLLVVVAGGINVASYDCHSCSERQKQLLLCHCPWSVKGDSRDAGLRSPPPSTTPFLRRLPLLLSSISPHLTSPPSLPSFFLSFSAALKHQHQQAVDNARKHTHTPSSDVLSSVLLLLLCVWA